MTVVAKEALRVIRAELSRSGRRNKEAHPSQMGMDLATHCFAEVSSVALPRSVSLLCGPAGGESPLAGRENRFCSVDALLAACVSSFLG